MEVPRGKWVDRSETPGREHVQVMPWAQTGGSGKSRQTLTEIRLPKSQQDTLAHQALKYT